MATIEVPCRFCHKTEHVRKHGVGKKNYPRFRCQECRRTFQLEYAYNACKPGIEEQVEVMSRNTAGIRDTARVLGISANTVSKILKNSTHHR